VRDHAKELVLHLVGSAEVFCCRPRHVVHLLSAAAIQLGATGAQTVWDFVNTRTIAGLALYGVGSLLWIIALARLPLSKVYPFTILTFVLVYAASATILGEPMTPRVLAGAGLVIAGLLVITTA
jgi:drug/metabolite transporter (DMT)-like permease